jgi:hypothetical protein
MHRHAWRCAACVVSLVAVVGAPLVGHPAAAAPVPPRPLLITPTQFDFGEIFIGETSPAQEVVVTNVSAASVTLTTVSTTAISSPQFTAGTTDCTVGLALAPGAACTFPYTFTPAPPVGPPVVATTSVTVNGQTSDVVLVGAGLEPFLVSPTALDFGPVEADGESGYQAVTITNVSTTTRSLTVTGAIPTAPFVLVGPGDPGACTVDLPLDLPPFGSCQLRYGFVPQDPGEVERTLTLSVAGRPVDVTLFGSGAGEIVFGVQLTPAAVDHGAQFVGFPGMPLGGTLTVFGGFTYEITSITGPANPEFERFLPPTVNCAEDLQLSAVGESPVPSCLLLYTYTPGDWGPPDEDEVIVTLDDGEGTWEVRLALRGESRRPLLVTPIGFDFGDVALGATAPEQTATVTNMMPAPLERVVRDAFVIAAPLTVWAIDYEAPPFGGTTTCTDAVLAPGDTCTIEYAFTPVAFGSAETTADAVLEYTVGALPNGVALQQVDGDAFFQDAPIALEGAGVDLVPPTITVAVTPAAPASTGWYNLATGAPTVSFTCTDPAPGSGLASCTGPTTLASSASGQTVTGTAVDVAGNTATATSPTLLVDLVAPTLACGVTPTFIQGAAGTVTATVTDAESGPVATTASVAADTATVGEKTVTVSGSDRAGNTTAVSCPYVVTATLPPTGGDPVPGLLLAGAFLATGTLLLALKRRPISS